MPKIRLDVLLVERGFVSSREKAKALIMAGDVFINGQREDKPGTSFQEDKIKNIGTSGGGSSSGGGGNEKDSYFVEAGKFIIEKEKASIGMLQRVFKIGFNRAARIMDQLADAGVVGEEEGTKPRKVLMTMEEFEQYIEDYV